VLTGVQDKTWLQFQVAYIKEIAWNDQAFTRLVLPDNNKEVMLAFAKSQIQCEHKFDDIIEGKGKGVSNVPFVSF
jgi:hypothetical protein